MRKIPLKMRAEIAADPFMKRCIYSPSDECSGRVEWEHAFEYAGKQINERWAIVPVCTYHHRGEGLNKEFNQYWALWRSTPEDLLKYPRKDWATIWRYLKKKYS